MSVHWGQEYHLENSSSQQELAHKIIEAGADLIIGHHPHVVQSIEEYKGKLIFYSLGNFVFDQYFSEETRQGLAVWICLGRETAAFRLLPAWITNGQPDWMSSDEAKAFLASLAERSDKDLYQAIKNGIIVK